ncbi:hypothetical protein WDW89_22695 [Deltaproteobacteria bacterium TL4]
MVRVQLSYYFNRILLLANEHRSLSSFCFVLAILVSVDVLFHNVIFPAYLNTMESLYQPVSLEESNPIGLGFSPQYWIGMLAMVLGTLVIVISIASQSIPKLIDIYMQDRVSLFFIWFIILSGAHVILVRMYGDITLYRQSSRMLNTHVLIPVCIFLTFPYIFYILKYTKPINVINRISKNQFHLIKSLAYFRISSLMDMPIMVEMYQRMMFEALNQLDDLLEYVNFKEPKADIIQDLNRSLIAYIRGKSKINPKFFLISPSIRIDISFKTLVGQFEELERTRTFYEQKCFRLLGNIYINLIEDSEFDLASLCASWMTTIGLHAIEEKDDDLIHVIIVRFNTYLRFAIKHGAKNNEGRNLYTTAFHYGNFIEHLVTHQKIDHVKRCFMYLRIYGTEIFKHGKKSPALYFIVDVFAAEMKKILILADQKNWDLTVQESLLKELLLVDSPPDSAREDLAKGLLINNGVRVLQMGLALYYLKKGLTHFVDLIIEDALDDLEVLGENLFLNVIAMTCNRLRFSGPTFWEDTDRGNLNIYYTPDSDQIDEFQSKIAEKMRLRLLKKITQIYDLSPLEEDLIWKISQSDPKNEVVVLCKNADTFDKTLHLLSFEEEPQLKAVNALRNKLHFTTENMSLILTHTRQIALNTAINVSFLPPEQDPVISFNGIILNNELDTFSVKILKASKNFDRFSENKSAYFQLILPQNNFAYQFQSKIEDLSADCLKVAHCTHFKKILN